jgi:hypothetical protein
MHYKQQSMADPFGDDASIAGYQFPLITSPGGTCGNPPLTPSRARAVSDHDHENSPTYSVQNLRRNQNLSLP